MITSRPPLTSSWSLKCWFRWSRMLTCLHYSVLKICPSLYFYSSFIQIFLHNLTLNPWLQCFEIVVLLHRYWVATYMRPKSLYIKALQVQSCTAHGSIWIYPNPSLMLSGQLHYTWIHWHLPNSFSTRKKKVVFMFTFNSFILIDFLLCLREKNQSFSGRPSIY